MKRKVATIIITFLFILSPIAVSAQVKKYHMEFIYPRLTALKEAKCSDQRYISAIVKGLLEDNCRIVLVEQRLVIPYHIDCFDAGQQH